MGYLIFAILLLSFPADSMVRAGVQVDDDDGVYANDYANSTVWVGPGFYFGIWFDNEGQYDNWVYGRGYYYGGSYYNNYPYYYGPSFYYYGGGNGYRRGGGHWGGRGHGGGGHGGGGHGGHGGGGHGGGGHH